MPDSTHADPPCPQCTARCCRQRHSGWPFAVELEAGEEDRFADIAIYDPVVEAMVLPYNAQGQCHFLGDDNRCRIHAARPQTCRDFTCATGHIQFISRNPELLILIEAAEEDFSHR